MVADGQLGAFGGMVTKDWKERPRSTEQMYGEALWQGVPDPRVWVFPRLDPPLPTPGQYDVELILQSAAPVEQLQDSVDQVLGCGIQERQVPLRRQ